MHEVQSTQMLELHETGRRPVFARPLVRLGLLMAVIAAAHGYSLTGGLWLDDHIHYQGLRDAGWNVRDLIHAATLDPSTTHFQVWGLMEQGLRFFRPVAFGLMKAQYTLVHWEPAWMHLFSLAWHLVVAMLVGALVTRLLRDGAAGTFAAVLFAVFPNHVPTVYWIACQTELMVTSFILISILAYGAWARWFVEDGQADEKRQRRGRSGLAVAIVAFGLALGCRENAIVLPGILIAGDLLSHGVKVWRRRAAAWLMMAGLAVVYLLIRRVVMGGMAWPPRPYMVYPSDADFLAFATRKMMYYLGGLFLYLPILPGSASDYFAEKTWLLPLSLVVSLVIPVAAVVLWRRKIVLLGVVWIVLIFGPSIGVALAPHHLYLPGVGAALLLTAVLVGLWRTMQRHLPLFRWKGAALTLGGLLLVANLAACFVVGWLYINGTAAEDQVVADVLELSDPLQSGDELFFINLPLMCGWPGPAIETTARQRLRNLRTYALTLSDEVVMMTQPTEVIPEDRQHLRLKTGSPGWLVGASGKIFAELARVKQPFEAGQQVPGPVFDVTIEEVDSISGGITQLLLVFREPIDMPGRHFYLGSPYQMAYPLHFAWGSTNRVIGP